MNKTHKDRKYNEIYGKEKSSKIRKKISNSLKSYYENNKDTEKYKERNKKISRSQKGRKNPNKGKKLEEIYGMKKYLIIKEKIIKSLKKHHNEFPATKEKIIKSLKKYYSENETFKKGKTYEELYGIEKSESIKKKMRINGKDKNKGRILSESQKKKIGKKNSILMKQMYINNPERIEYQKRNRMKQILPTKDTSIEVKIQNFLKQLNIEFFTHQYIKEIEHGYQCDVLIPSMNLIIECDGNYWHKYPIGREIDHIRTKELFEKGFKVLRLWEHEINKMNVEEFERRLF